MIRKARAGYVTGGRVFGYDNVEVPGPDGRRAHVLRQVNDAKSVIVRRIFDLSRTGHGLTAVRKPSTRRRRRRRGPSSIGRTPGRPRQCAKCSTGICIGDSSTGTRPGSGTCEAK
jgi:hypothetical protein